MKATMTRNRLSTHGPEAPPAVFRCKYKGCKRTFGTLPGLNLHVMWRHTHRMAKAVAVRQANFAARNGHIEGPAAPEAPATRRYTRRAAQPQPPVDSICFCPKCGFNLAMFQLAFTVAQKHGV